MVTEYNPRHVYLKISHLLDLLVDNDANSMLGDVVHTSRFAMVTLVRHSFLDCTCALKKIICKNITPDFHHRIKCGKWDYKTHNMKSCISPWCQRCRPSCRCACTLTGGQGLWSKPRNIFICTRLGILKPINPYKWCAMTDQIQAIDCAHHVCGMACWTCTWSPSSCLLCWSWCLFTMKEIRIKVRLLHTSVCAHAWTFYTTHWFSTCDGSMEVWSILGAHHY